ncbi:calpain-13-like [Phyllobates terribilis]|uniref:calpain-13-like n=1 Tax=Phyllobates terribilis TaxID=111132 RepID=UPI003CCB43C1
MKRSSEISNMNLTRSSDSSMGSLENLQKFYNQDFEILKEHCLEKDALFTDEYFPANMNSIGLCLKNEFNTNNIEWKRPKDICKEPCFTVDGISLSDILHSRRGDCWVLSVIGSVTMKPEILAKVIPDNQGFTKRYAGIFHFRFWHLGEWMDVVIDDRLPFLDGKYLSLQPSCGNEFWPCLLEKAYAKFLGSYEKLHMADPAETFVNLTGGLTVTLDLKNSKVDTYWNMISLASQDTMMACISDKQNPLRKNQTLSLILQRFNPSNWRNIFKKKLPENALQDKSLVEKLEENVLQNNGLVECHAYSITKYAKVPFRDGDVRLIRLWNPWGSGEWNGDWNDRCPLWNELRAGDRQRLQKIDDDDGEFWMCWEDFIKEFSKLIICNQVPDFYDWGDQDKKWYRKMFRSRWTKVNLSWNNIDKDFFIKNPLYIITVTATDEVKSGENVVVSLMQASRNRHKYDDWLPIGFEMFEFPDSQDKIPDSLLTPEKISSIESCRNHNVAKAYNLSPGRYGIIPYTTQKKRVSSFLFQVFLKSEGCIDDMSLRQSPNDAETIFKAYSTKESKIFVWNLKQLLNDQLIKEYSHPFNAKFTIDGCREILASVDISKKSKLDAGTFAKLWKIITQYKDHFNQVNTNGSGYISLTALHKIIKQTGLNVQNDLLQQLFARYSDGQGKLSFVDYLVCTMRLKGFMETFYKLTADDKITNMTVEKWLQLMM